MPQADEIAEIAVNGQRFTDWQTVQVTRSFKDLASSFAFTAASPIESGTSWSGKKLAIGDQCQIYLAGRQVIDGRIRHRQPAYDKDNHGLQVAGSSLNASIARATVDHEKGEYKKQSLSQIANSVLKPLGIRFYTQGDTSGMDKIFDKVNLQAGETIHALLDRLCRFRNAFMFDDAQGNIIAYRLGSGTGAIAELEEGRNIKAASATFDYEGAFSEVKAVLQKPGNNESHGDDARDVSAMVRNSAIREHVPLFLMGEMPGDKKDAMMRAQHENAENIATQVNVQITVQGWHNDDNSLWIERVGEVVSVYSPMLFTNDHMNLAINEVTCSQSEAGTLSTLGLVLPERLNGGGMIDGTPSIPGFLGSAA